MILTTKPTYSSLLSKYGIRCLWYICFYQVLAIDICKRGLIISSLLPLTLLLRLSLLHSADVMFVRVVVASNVCSRMSVSAFVCLSCNFNKIKYSIT